MKITEKRRSVVAELLRGGPVESQEELRRRLLARGIEATQATLSRDLRELAAVKTPAGYVLPGMVDAADAGSASGAGLADAMARYVLSTRVAASIVVLRTGPGEAQVVALELDRTPPAGVVGTVAGDDTVFVATGGAKDAARVCEQLRSAAGLTVGGGGGGGGTGGGAA